MPSGRPAPGSHEAEPRRSNTEIWRAVTQRVRARANLMLKGRATRTEIDDLCNEALCRLVEEELEADLELMLGRVYVIVKSLVRNHFRRHRNRWLELRSDVDVANDAIASRDRDDRRDRALALLRQRLRDDPLATQILDHMLIGEDRPRFLAPAIGVSIADINAAKRRLWRQVDIVRRRVGRR